MLNDEIIAAALRAHLAQSHPHLIAEQVEAIAAAHLERLSPGVRSDPSLVALGTNPELIGIDVDALVKNHAALFAPVPDAAAILAREGITDAERRLTRYRELQRMTPAERLQAAKGLVVADAGKPAAVKESAEALGLAKADALGVTGGEARRDYVNREHDAIARRAFEDNARRDLESKGDALDAAERLTLARLQKARC
jgi:hypothetical protein